MSRNPDKQARIEAMLGDVAELSLMVIRETAVRLRETEDNQEFAALGSTFEGLTRSLRLTLALSEKVERDTARDLAADARAAREAEAEARAEADRAETSRHLSEVMEQGRRAPQGPVEIRKDRIVSLTKRLLWNESEGDSETYDILIEDLEVRLDEAARHPDFLTTPIETLARRLLADMGISAHFALSMKAPEPATADTG